MNQTYLLSRNVSRLRWYEKWGKRGYLMRIFRIHFIPGQNAVSMYVCVCRFSTNVYKSLEMTYSPRSSRLFASSKNIMPYGMMVPGINQRAGALCLVLRLSSGGGNA